MDCARCDGLMVQDYFYDVQESFGETWAQGWRCISCGEIIDPVIQSHRLLQSVELSLPKGEPSTRESLKTAPVQLVTF